METIIYIAKKKDKVNPDGMCWVSRMEDGWLCHAAEFGGHNVKYIFGEEVGKAFEKLDYYHTLRVNVVTKIIEILAG